MKIPTSFKGKEVFNVFVLLFFFRLFGYFYTGLQLVLGDGSVTEIFDRSTTTHWKLCEKLPLFKKVCSTYKLFCFGQSLHARRTGGMTSPYCYYSYNFLLLEALLPFQPLSPSLWMWLQCCYAPLQRTLAFPLQGCGSSCCWRWGLNVGMIVCPVGIWTCICVCVLAGIFSSFTETPLIVTDFFLFNILLLWYRLN